MSTPPLWKVTVPPSGAGLTVAVNVTDWPAAGELGLLPVTAIVVSPGPTVSSAGPVSSAVAR